MCCERRTSEVEDAKMQDRRPEVVKGENPLGFGREQRGARAKEWAWACSGQVGVCVGSGRLSVNSTRSASGPVSVGRFQRGRAAAVLNGRKTPAKYLSGGGCCARGRTHAGRPLPASYCRSVSSSPLLADLRSSANAKCYWATITEGNLCLSQKLGARP